MNDADYLSIGKRKRAALAYLFCSVVSAFVSPRSLPAQDTLQPVLDRIHQHAVREDWKQAGWKDDVIEGWLDNLAGTLAKAAEFLELKLPVRFADVTAGEIAPDRDHQKALLVGNFDLKGAKLYNSIVLADGNVIADTAEGCVIVARGAVELQNSAWSVIVAGAHVTIASHDGQSPSSKNGSLIATRGRASLQTAYGTVLYAGEGAAIQSSRNAVFINAVLVGSSRDRSRSVKVKNVALEDLPVHPIAARIQILGIIYPEALDSSELPPAPFQPGAQQKQPPELTGIALKFDGRRYVAEIGKTIVDEADQPVAALADWKLSYANKALAIFSSDDADAVVQIEK